MYLQKQVKENPLGISRVSRLPNVKQPEFVYPVGKHYSYDQDGRLVGVDALESLSKYSASMFRLQAMYELGVPMDPVSLRGGAPLSQASSLENELDNFVEPVESVEQ